jgi:cell shape-determining protein MreD
VTVAGARRTWLLAVGLVALHLLLHVGFGYGRGAPDLLTIGLLLVAREVGLGWAAATGLLFGLIEDSLSVLSFGANAVAMTTIGILGAITRDLFVGDSRLFAVSYFLAGKWTRDLLHWLMIGRGLRPPFFDEVLVQGFLGGLYAAAVGLVLVTVAAGGREL